MEVRTELDSKQRELLMRMYRSRLNEEVFPVSFDISGVGEALMACGFIVAVNGFYEFTKAGLQEWKAYGNKLNAVRKQHDLKYRQKKQAEVEQKKMAKEIALSDWEKKARENPSPKQMNALRTLYEAGADTVWVSADIHHITRDTLVLYGYIEYDKYNNKYWLLDAGVQKLELNGAYRNDTTEGLPMPHELPVFDDTNPTTLPVDDEGVDALEHCDTCAGCVDHEILHMLAQKYPAIGRLRQMVLETRRLIDELGIKK